MPAFAIVPLFISPVASNISPTGSWARCYQPLGPSIECFHEATYRALFCKLPPDLVRGRSQLGVITRPGSSCAWVSRGTVKIDFSPFAPRTLPFGLEHAQG